MSQKKCFKCGAEKPLSEFYKHKGMADGRLNKCKECAKKDSTKRRWNKIEEAREYDRKRGNRQGYKYIKEYREKYPKKYKAHRFINNGIKSGLLNPEPCCVCGTKENLVAHHDDYNKPLEIRWMCQAHHKQWHRDNGEGLNPT
jgi:hypothetical protein